MRTRVVPAEEIRPPNGTPEPTTSALKSYLVELAMAHNKMANRVADLSEDLHDDLVDLNSAMAGLGEKIDKALADSSANATRMTIREKVVLGIWSLLIGCGGLAGAALAVIKLGEAL